MTVAWAGGGLAGPSAAVRPAVPIGAIDGLSRVGETAPVPRGRPERARIVGRVENGRAVPLSASAFAARAGAGPMGDLFRAAEAAAGEGDPGALRAVVGPQVPTPTPTPTHEPPQTSPPFATRDWNAEPLRGALDALRADRYVDALARRNAMSDPLDRLIVDYFLMRSGSSVMTSAMIADYAGRAADWPSARLTRARAEEALARERRDAGAIVAAMGGEAVSPTGVRLLARAMIARGEADAAMILVREDWHGHALGTAMQSAFLTDFGDRLSIEDHLTRIDKLVANNRFDEAKALRGRLEPGPRAYLDARLVVATDSGDADASLGRVPSDLRGRPGYRLAEIEVKRRAGRLDEAARLIRSAPRSGIVDRDAWWVETRIVARMIAEAGNGRLAYDLVARAPADGATERADQAFHAGWFALRYLRDGRLAEQHFAGLEAIATTPISSARAGYWRGRAAALRRDEVAARVHYASASRYGFTYYGQLARAELGVSGTGVGRRPEPDADDRSAFARNEVAEAVRRLIATGHGHRIVPLVEHLGETLPTPGQVALAVAQADGAGMAHVALMVAKDAQRRGVDVGGLAYPTEAIPREATIPDGLDRALVYSIARQESSFNPGAVSPVGARGLMQVMPQTAAAMARELGVRHSQAKLTADPAHNAMLGAAYLDKRLGEFDGSYILTFAAYNAGAARVREWIARFGDPRDANVDPVAWVEDIPYPETRNYVQRVLENVQVYREALGTGRNAIMSDLTRGRRG